MATNSVPATVPAASLKLRNTTVFLVRHADVPAGTNPHLNAAGLTRASELIRVLGAIGIVAVYASEFARTRETAQPLATHLGLTVKVMTGGRPRRDRSGHPRTSSGTNRPRRRPFEYGSRHHQPLRRSIGPGDRAHGVRSAVRDDPDATSQGNDPVAAARGDRSGAKHRDLATAQIRRVDLARL